MENVLMAVFAVESEAFQAFSDIKNKPVDGKSIISQAVLVKKDGNNLKTPESFDTGLTTADDTTMGGLIGSCVGILGGPLGVLFGASLGMMSGSIVDAMDITDNASLLEQIAGKLTDGAVAILALTQEEDPKAINDALAKYNVTISRYAAAEVQEDVEEAAQAQRAADKKAREALRKEKTAELKSKIDENRKKIAQEFDEFKKKLMG